MASVTFNPGLFLHDIDDYDDYITVDTRRDPQVTRAPRGEVRFNAAGARRWAPAPGAAERATLSWRTRDATHPQWLERRESSRVLYRDRRGRVWTAALTNVTIQDLNSLVYDIAVALDRVDG